MPGNASAQLHNLASYMVNNGVSEFMESSFELKHIDFVGSVLVPARGLTDTGARQPVDFSCSTVV